MQTQSVRHLPLPFLHASKKHTGRSKKGELQQTATYLEIQHRASLHCLLNKQHVHCPWHHGEMSIELVIMFRLSPTIWTHPVTAYPDGDVRLHAYLNSGDGIGKFRPRRGRRRDNLNSTGITCPAGTPQMADFASHSCLVLEDLCGEGRKGGVQIEKRLIGISISIDVIEAVLWIWS